MLAMIERWKKRAKSLQTETRAVYFASRDSRVPWHVRVLAIAIVAYALSPIDLIPDFIPVLGYVDDLFLLPLGVYLLLRLIPSAVMEECRERAAREGWSLGRKGRIAAIVIVLIWVAVAALITVLVLKALGVL